VKSLLGDSAQRLSITTLQRDAEICPDYCYSGFGHWAVGTRQWAVGGGQWAVGSGRWAVAEGEKINSIVISFLIAIGTQTAKSK
jgi:hypothetical protein